MCQHLHVPVSPAGGLPWQLRCVHGCAYFQEEDIWWAAQQAAWPLANLAVAMWFRFSECRHPSAARKGLILKYKDILQWQLTLQLISKCVFLNILSQSPLGLFIFAYTSQRHQHPFFTVIKDTELVLEIILNNFLLLLLLLFLHWLPRTTLFLIKTFLETFSDPSGKHIVSWKRDGELSCLSTHILTLTLPIIGF